MKTIFDKIYVLSLITNKERQSFIRKQMSKLGLDFEFIYGTPFYKLTNDADNNRINYPNVWPFPMPPTSPRSYGCTISHFNGVAFAYELGYNNVLIIEDDICFLKDKNIIEWYLNNIPSDADFVTFDPRFNDINHFNDMSNKTSDNKEFIKIDNAYGSLSGGMMYGIMNRKTMELYLNNQCNKLLISDRVRNIFWTDENSNINRYCSSQCLCIGQYILEKYFNKNYNNNFMHSNNDLLCYTLLYKNVKFENFYKPSKFISWTHF